METNLIEVVEDQSVRDTQGRRITSRQRRDELLAQYKTSGLTQKAFAKRAGVNCNTFISWLADERRGAAAARDLPEAAGRPVRFVELSAPARAIAAPSVMEVVLRDGRVARGAQASALAELVRRLEG